MQTKVSPHADHFPIVLINKKMENFINKDKHFKITFLLMN